MSYDLIVIGSGPAGRRAAVQAAKLKKSVLVIEKGRRVGGVCVHTGTIPSKTLRETVLIEGQGAQTNTRRWEDYATTAIDPSDDCTFWYAGDYFKKESPRYSSRIGSFRVPGCK